ncbi:MAG: hypothetical protein ACOX6N_04950 [Patescibacteria group bacterium]|jgi:hypothetical protein
MISEKTVREFMGIYRDEFKKDISFKEAKKQAANLLHLYKLILTPSKGISVDNLGKNGNN